MPSPGRKTSKQPSKQPSKRPAIGDEPREQAGRKAAATATPSERKRGSTRASEVKHTELYPKPPMPKQHQDKPGIEAEVHPRPQYMAPGYKGSGKLQGRIALITGGDSGIGRAVAVLYAREGADVAIVYLPEEDVDAQETRAAIEAEGRRALLLPGDVTSWDFCKQAVRRTVAELGGLDILVNNAAYQNNVATLEELTIEQFDRTFRTNIYGYFYMAKAALPHLREGCAIVNTGSETGIQGAKELLDYSATKGAIHAFTKSLSQNLSDRKIRVNCVAPGPVWTPLNPAAQNAEKVAEFGADVPMGRPAQPEELAPVYVFLASNVDSSYLSGAVIPVMGGQTVGG